MFAQRLRELSEFLGEICILVDVKEAVYKRLVRPVLEYGSSLWDPHTHSLQEELDKFQNRAARFVTGNCVFETGNKTFILGQLK